LQPEAVQPLSVAAVELGYRGGDVSRGYLGDKPGLLRGDLIRRAG
jgi:hypothetical protein